jgi:hypothetical protein
LTEYPILVAQEVVVAVPVEAFLADAYLAGTYAGTSAALREQLHEGSTVELADVTLVSLAGLVDGTAERAAAGSLSPGDVFMAALPLDPEAPHIHRVYYTVELALGPYAVVGDMAMLPGFDPGRALTRPATDFVELRGAEVRIAAPGEEIVQEYDHLSVNRFAVERVGCEVDVTFWFPGAFQQLPPDE